MRQLVEVVFKQQMFFLMIDYLIFNIQVERSDYVCVQILCGQPNGTTANPQSSKCDI